MIKSKNWFLLNNSKIILFNRSPRPVWKSIDCFDDTSKAKDFLKTLTGDMLYENKRVSYKDVPIFELYIDKKWDSLSQNDLSWFKNAQYPPLDILKKLEAKLHNDY